MIPEAHLTAKKLESGDVSLIIDSKFAEGFHSFLSDKGVQTSAPTDAVFVHKRFYRDQAGRVQREHIVVDREIVASITIEEAEDFFAEWFGTPS